MTGNGRKSPAKEKNKSIAYRCKHSPAITISFTKQKDVDAETINKLFEDNNDKEILKLIVRGLQKADSLQKGMNLAHYKFNWLNMKIGYLPISALSSHERLKIYR